MSVLSKTIQNKSIILSRPRVTEKATFLAGSKNPVYTFEVAKTATKSEILKLIKEKYKLSPVKINIVNLPAKKVRVRGREGFKNAVKKAMVFLKAGEKIELV